MASWKLKVPRPNLSNQLQEPLANKSKLRLNLAFEKLSRDCRESNFFSEKLSFFNQPSTMRFISCSPEILKRESCDSAKSKKVPEMSIKYSQISSKYHQIYHRDGFGGTRQASNIDPFYHQILTTTSGHDDPFMIFHRLSSKTNPSWKGLHFFWPTDGRLEMPRKYQSTAT